MNFAERLSNAKMKSLVVVEEEEVSACENSPHKTYTVDNLEQALQRKTFSQVTRKSTIMSSRVPAYERESHSFFLAAAIPLVVRHVQTVLSPES